MSTRNSADRRGGPESGFHSTLFACWNTLSSPQIRQRMLSDLHDEPARMLEPGAQRDAMLGGIAGERGDNPHVRLVLEPRSRSGPRVLLAIAGDELEVTAQGRLDQCYVAQTVQVIHGALSLSSGRQ